MEGAQRIKNRGILPPRVWRAGTARGLKRRESKVIKGRGRVDTDQVLQKNRWFNVHTSYNVIL